MPDIILKGDKEMKKIFCLTLVVTVLLSVLIFPASASFLDVSGSSLDVSEDTSGIGTSSSDSYDYVTDETNEPVVIYNPQTGEEVIFVLPVDSNDPARSSEPMISGPYTPPEKMPAGSKEN